MHHASFPLALHRLASGAALAASLILAGCGGGGGDDSPAAGSASAAAISESDATADASDASQAGEQSAASLDTVYDTTAALALSAAQPTAAADRAQALAVQTPVTNVVVDCAGGGTATVTLTGGTLASELNGGFDAGEHYSVTFAQCTGRAGFSALNGGVELDVLSVSSDASPVTAVTITATNLSVSASLGTVTLDGTANLSRAVATAGNVVTTTSTVTAPSLTLATAFNDRSGSFSLSNLDATRTVASTGGIASGSAYSGTHTLSGTANGRSFSMAVATSGSVTYDATGTPLAGQWQAVLPAATVAARVANGAVTITVDDGSDGTIDDTWTFPTAQLTTAAG